MDVLNTRKLSEHVYALSRLSHRHKNPPTKPKTMGIEERKILKVLDGISLLLVTEDKGDFVAVSFTQSTSTSTVHSTKNSPCNGALNMYIDGILEHISKYRNSSQSLLAGGISMRAIEECVKTVRHRIAKLLNALRDVMKDSLCNDDEIAQCLFPIAELPSEKRSDLVAYLRDLNALPTKDLEKLKSQVKQLYLVALDNYIISTGHEKAFAREKATSEFEGGFRSLAIIMARLSLSPKYVRNTEGRESMSSRLVTGTGVDVSIRGCVN
ncbi:hypothetical protein MMC29_006913 [Sticta canariensis]|nr:hypothetical protein [Sticta canariensis]